MQIELISWLATATAPLDCQSQSNNCCTDKRKGMGPIPSEPESYLRREQVNGLAVLRKFGWRLVCVRRPTKRITTTILINKETKKLGVLGTDGILRLTDNIKVRNRQKIKSSKERRKPAFFKFCRLAW